MIICEPSSAALQTALDSVVAIRRAGYSFVLGSGAVVRPGLVLTALHVVDGERVDQLRIDGRMPVAAVVRLPIGRFARRRRLAQRSYRRSRILTEHDGGTIDLALLVAPALRKPAAAIRRVPVVPGQRVAIAGYPAGCWTVNLGPVTSADEADFVLHVLLGPGASGAPAIDFAGRIAGLLTMDHLSAGAVMIGPELLGAFVERASQRATRHRRLRHLLPKEGCY